ncbi:MAG: peptidoglycan-binding protein [Candidatus Paceibacterota bacterium]
MASKLFIADRANHRVLIYNTIPISNGVSANLVIGQADFTSGTANRGSSVDANTFNQPNDIDIAGDKLIIADASNFRVLIFNQIPTDVNASADVVIGQSTMTTTINRCSTAIGVITASCVSLAIGVYSDDTHLFVSDFYNDRILVFNTIPTSNGASADVVIGQADFTSGRSNQNGYPAANTLQSPVHISSDSQRLFVAQNGVYAENVGGRVLIYPLGPLSSTATSPINTVPNEVTVSLNASADTKEFKISEDQNFAGASWQTYTTSTVFTLSEPKGSKTIYVKFRDYANYESAVTTLVTRYVGVGGSGHPVFASSPGGSYSPPVMVPTITSPITENVIPIPTNSTNIIYNFGSQTLKLRTKGTNVQTLQEFLNNHNYILTMEGAGSPGNETTFFGSLTKQAVIKFQKDNGLVPDGIVGVLTKGKMKDLGQ